MTEDQRELLLEVKAMLTSGAWGNEFSVCPLLGNSKRWWYGRVVPLRRGPYVINLLASGDDLYEHWTEEFELYAFDLIDDTVLTYFHKNYSDSKYEIKLDMMMKFSEDFYMKTLEESL